MGTNKHQESGREYQSVKQREALARNAEWQKLTPAQQLADLDMRLGKGKGAVKQRARIARLLEAQKHSEGSRETNVGNQTKTKAKDRRRQERTRAESED